MRWNLSERKISPSEDLGEERLSVTSSVMLPVYGCLAMPSCFTALLLKDGKLGIFVGDAYLRACFVIIWPWSCPQLRKTRSSDTEVLSYQK